MHPTADDLLLEENPDTVYKIWFSGVGVNTAEIILERIMVDALLTMSLISVTALQGANAPKVQALSAASPSTVKDSKNRVYELKGYVDGSWRRSSTATKSYVDKLYVVDKLRDGLDALIKRHPDVLQQTSSDSSECHVLEGENLTPGMSCLVIIRWAEDLASRARLDWSLLPPTKGGVVLTSQR